jgi:hypothetical protein
MSPRRNLDSATPSPASECAPRNQKGGRAHSPEVEGVRSPNSDDWKKSLALCVLCSSTYSCPFRDTVQYGAYHAVFPLLSHKNIMVFHQY